MKKSTVLALLLFLISSLITVHAQSVNNPPANSVLGQTDFVSYSSGLSASKFNGPMGVAIDSETGKVFISDRYNNRILRFSSTDAYINGASAEAVLGQTDFTTGTAAATPTASSLNNPIGIVLDKAGRLWAADFNNNRILRYDNAVNKTNGAAADGVLGQAGFTTKTSGVTASTLNGPVGIYVDGNDNLWVADFNNNRILKFASASAKSNGASADVVLGQTSFTLKTTGTTASTMSAPNGVYVDIYGNLWVSDRANYRFLRFDNASAKTTGANADGVLGQPDFTTKVSNTTKSGSGYARFVWGDKNGRIYCMQENHRITVFDNAASKANGADADGIIGQADYTSSAAPNPPTATSLKDPKGMFVNNSNGDVWVTDASNHRVLRYELNPVVTRPLTITAPNGDEEWGEGSIQNITWTGNYAGNVQLEYSTDSGLSWQPIDVAGTVNGNSSYSWVVPSVSSANCLVRVSDKVDPAKADTSDNKFLISNKVIVVVGSSTAAGQGPANIDSAWVWRYRRYVKSLNPNAMVVNLAVGGYSTYECMPTGFVPPAGKAAPHTNANITKALSYNPDAIIVNLPTNDAYWNYTLTETLANFDTIVTRAKNKNIPIWVTTSQGRNLSQAGRDLLKTTKDTILSIYKNYAVDFWTGLTGSDGNILSQYNSGDGVHMNSDAHKILCQRIIDARVLDAIIPPKFSMTPNKLPFGDVVMNNSKKDSITVTNDGEGVLVIDSVRVDNSLFTVTPTNASVAPNSSAKFIVSFSPNFAGESTGHFILYHNPFFTTDTVSLSGNGVDPTPLVSIASAREDKDNDFVADRKGDTLKVAGIVISPDFTASASGHNYYVSDGKSGLLLYSKKKFNTQLSIGDSILVKGTVDQYNGVVEFVPVDTVVGGKGSIQLLKARVKVPDPIEISLKDLNSEKYEGCLVKIKRIRPASTSTAWPSGVAANVTNMTVYAGIDTTTLFIDNDTDIDGNAEPSWPEDIAGIATQYDKTAPYSSGYEIAPRSIADFTVVPADTTPVVTIKEARKDLDNDFIPDNLGKTFKVKAVVVSLDFTASTTTNNNYFITDGTAGILLYAKPKLNQPLSIGDSIIVKGKIAQYKGATEFAAVDTLVGEDGSVQILKTGAKVPAPIEISVSDVNSEKYEGSLVLVKGLSKRQSSTIWPAAGQNAGMTVGTQTDSTTLFIDNDTDIDGMTEPVWPQDIIGVISQYSSSATPNNGYELLPRSKVDFLKTTGISNRMNRIPEAYALDQNYPNPFNPSTKISFDLRVNASVTVKVYSIIGQEISTLLNNSQMSAGHQIVNFNANSLPSGIYIYKLSVKGSDGSNFNAIRKMMLVK